MKKVFCENDFLQNFIDKCFKKFLDNIDLVKENLLTGGRKHSVLVLLYLEVIPLQTRTKLQQALKGVSNYYKLKIAFKRQIKLSNFFRVKRPILKDLIFEFIYKFQCSVCSGS